MATYEGKWRCPRCQSVNLGRFLNCQSCGVKRSEDVEFFLDEADMPPVEDAELLIRANAGTDWICRYCGGGNSALDAKCSSCGNSRTGDDVTLVEETREKASDWAEKSKRKTTREAPEFLNSFQPADDSKTANRKSFGNFLKSWALKFGIFGAVATLVAVCALLVYLSTLTYPVDVEVQTLEWSRSIRLEEYRTIRQTGWENELPIDADIISSSKEFHHNDHILLGESTVMETCTERVPDGTERYVCGKTNKKNGFFSDKYCTRTKYKTITKKCPRTVKKYVDVPIYKNRYEYEVDRWMPAGSRDTSGQNFNPQWDAVVVDNRRIREAGRSETYNLVARELGGNNKLYKINVGNRWNNFSQGQKLHGKVNWFGSLVSVEELPGNEW